MARCKRWEDLYNWALQNNNPGKALEFKEKLVECIVYTAQTLIAQKELDEAEELLEYGKEVAKKYNIFELDFHINLLMKEINRIRELRRKQQQQQ